MWRTGQTTELTAGLARAFQPWGSPNYLTAHFWELHALALHLPRHFPEHTDPADIEATVRHVHETEFLPWEME